MWRICGEMEMEETGRGRERERQRCVRDMGLDMGQQRQDRACLNMSASDNDREMVHIE